MSTLTDADFGSILLPQAFSKFSLPLTRTHPEVLPWKTSMWSTTHAVRVQSFNCCHDVPNGNYQKS